MTKTTSHITRRAALGGAAALGGTAAMLAAPRVARAQSQRVLKFVPHADLTVLDPVFNTTAVTNNHAAMIFDSLYGFDANFQAHPPMVEGHICQSAFKFDPASASILDPFGRRVLAVALAPSELVGVAETVRARAA